MCQSRGGWLTAAKQTWCSIGRRRQIMAPNIAHTIRSTAHVWWLDPVEGTRPAHCQPPSRKGKEQAFVGHLVTCWTTHRCRPGHQRLSSLGSKHKGEIDVHIANPTQKTQGRHPFVAIPALRPDGYRHQRWLVTVSRLALRRTKEQRCAHQNTQPAPRLSQSAT